MKPQRIIIVGGSIGGLFAAVLLHRAGFDVTVYERSVHGLEGRGAGLVAQQEVFAILREVGLEHNADIGVLARERIYLDRDDRIIRRMHMPQSQLSWDVLFRSFRDLLPN
ncbi:MAG: FAD-dependent monooxygenase, partial [Roseiarcus sp.]